MDAALTPELPHQALTARNRSQPGKVTGRLRAALMSMVWEGKTRRDAAQAADLKEHALYVALRKPHVKAFYLSELDVLRTSERARNIHRLIEIREKAENMPAVNAIKALEQIADDPSASSTQRQSLPGVVVQIINTNGNAPRPDMQTLVNVSGRDEEGPL